ncbi:hypothetical protein K440DRAFT_637216 [Wilcoxina mikolae CBS 423.85]|nr:hypothetical protein K440DRAFT_637216 [Wilcoxina mikolae CBS 423.85]
MPVAYYLFKDDQSRPRTLSPSAPPPNRQIPSVSPVLISSALPTDEEKLIDVEALTPSKSLSSENSSTEIFNIPDMTPDNVTEVVDEITEVINEDEKATSSDNQSSETAVIPTPTPNSTDDKPIDGYDAVVTCSDYMERDVRYTHLVGEEEQMITYHHGIYGKHAPLIVQRAINREPDVFQTARDQIVSGMIAMRNAINWAEETLGEASYFINELRKREDDRRKRTQRE